MWQVIKEWLQMILESVGENTVNQMQQGTYFND